MLDASHPPRLGHWIRAALPQVFPHGHVRGSVLWSGSGTAPAGSHLPRASNTWYQPQLGWMGHTGASQGQRFWGQDRTPAHAVSRPTAGASDANRPRQADRGDVARSASATCTGGGRGPAAASCGGIRGRQVSARGRGKGQGKAVTVRKQSLQRRCVLWEGRARVCACRALAMRGGGIRCPLAR